MEEQWKPLIYGNIDLSERMEISNTGKLRNIETKREYRTFISKSGYEVVNISLGCREKRKLLRIHRAVAYMFVTGYQEGLVVNHKDLNKINNNADNLEWITTRDNVYHAIKNHEKSNWTHIAKKVRCKETNEVFDSINDAKRWCGISGEGISMCIKGVLKHSGRHPITKQRLSWESV